MKVGILALQGAFIEHEKILQKIGIETFEIRQKEDIKDSFDGLILPGGESTVMGKLLHDLELFNPLQAMIFEGFPVFGTCAGLLLLAKGIINDNRLHFAAMDITAKRNAYGRQLGSFYTEEEFKGIGKIPMTFIRAPYIESVQSDTEILAMVNNQIVAAKQKNQLVTSFHPELNKDTAVHEYFIKMIKEKK
ncbi:MAG: pyridoxal 5'-phosphate synthase glutaminase subunit PdxT [Anaerovorax sp.]|nr:pyridoxal 5'-phosphate synthase glutaminase subunit PdxT [Anaerovorax sp.]